MLKTGNLYLYDKDLVLYLNTSESSQKVFFNIRTGQTLFFNNMEICYCIKEVRL